MTDQVRQYEHMSKSGSKHRVLYSCLGSWLIVLHSYALCTCRFVEELHANNLQVQYAYPCTPPPPPLVFYCRLASPLAGPGLFSGRLASPLKPIFPPRRQCKKKRPPSALKKILSGCENPSSLPKELPGIGLGASWS
jgi:hypothetical protein